jgi:stage V sporulation protein G
MRAGADDACTLHITEVKVFPVNEDKLKAYITVVLDNCFVVRDLKIINGTAGIFVAMPSKRRKDGTFKDIAHPLNQETRNQLEKVILDAYHAEVGRTGAESFSVEEAERADS